MSSIVDETATSSLEHTNGISDDKSQSVSLNKYYQSSSTSDEGGLDFENDDGEGGEDTIKNPLDRGPYFDISASKNVTALVGNTAYLNCRVRNLGNRTVSVCWGQLGCGAFNGIMWINLGISTRDHLYM